MSRAVRVLGWAAVGAATVAYIVLAHHVTAHATQAGRAEIALAVAPYLGFALVLAWRSSRRHAMLALIALAAAVLWHYVGDLALHLGWFYFLQHVGANVMLAAMFGRTLGREQVPICSRFAAMVHGPLSDRLARYTRQVTQAWTAFFALTAMLSVVLFFAAPIEIWSAFANVLSLPLVALMFGIEYAVRLRVLPEVEHATILDSMRMYWNSSRVSLPPSR